MDLKFAPARDPCSGELQIQHTSKGSMGGQGKGMRRASIRSGLLALSLIALTGGSAHASASDRPTPSGLPVPRYVSLKFGEVNARAGPGDDHRLLWIYRVKGLPVQVVAETAEWRRICDPEGGLAWVHRRTTDGRRMVLNTRARPVPLRRSPKAESHATAYLVARGLASLDRCKGGWCRVKADRATGWAPAWALWGASDAAQCR
jgi:SH3-like domain-containing protein